MKIRDLRDRNEDGHARIIVPESTIVSHNKFQGIMIWLDSGYLLHISMDDIDDLRLALGELDK